MYYKKEKEIEFNSRLRRSSPEFSSSRASTVSRGYGTGLSSSYETSALHSPATKKYSSLVAKEMNGLSETRRLGRSDGIKSAYEISKDDKSFTASSSPYRANASPTFRNVKSPTSPTLSSSRRYGSVDRDFDQHHRTDRNRSEPSPTTTVWLSKKMKEAALNGFADSPLTSGDKQRSYSPHSSTRYERSKSDLEPSASRRQNSLESPTDSINFMIPRRETSQYMSAERDLLSPRESVISRSSGRPSSDYRHKASPSKEYKSLHDFSTSNLKSPDLFPQSSARESASRDPSKFYPDIYQSRDRSNSFHDLREPSSVLRDLPKSRVRHKTLAYGVSGQDLERAKLGAPNKGSDEDMKSILRELEDTGYFSKAQTAPTPIISGRESWVKKKSISNADVDYKKLALVNDDLLKMWEESQAENTRLRLELSGVKSDLETARYQLETAAKQVTKNNAVTDQEKREKQIVVKKLAEMEEELKLLALSENLTDQTLDQLKNDNARLRDENGALLRVIAKMSK